MRVTATRTTEGLLLALTLFFLGLILQPAARAADAVFTNSLGMEFVLVPAGSFIMGSPEDEPGRGTSERQHNVTISRPFYLQTTEVTVAQWKKVMGRRLFGSRRGPDDMPVVRVSWYDAQKFIRRLNLREEGRYRLPTDAEWEYAARAGSTTAYSWGEKIDCSRAMYANNRRRHGQCVDYVLSKGLKPDRPAPVKSYLPNAWGLYDMHGNVWEWCQDRFDPNLHRYDLYKIYYLHDPVSESGKYRIRRGGSWFGSKFSCRSANRTFSHAGIRYKTTGFRLVREAQ